MTRGVVWGYKYKYLCRNGGSSLATGKSEKQFISLLVLITVERYTVLANNKVGGDHSDSPQL